MERTIVSDSPDFVIYYNSFFGQFSTVKFIALHNYFSKYMVKSSAKSCYVNWTFEILRN